MTSSRQEVNHVRANQLFISRKADKIAAITGHKVVGGEGARCASMSN